jgi:3-oxoacyl-[acyl-carrier-protein] synthase II
MKEIVISGIGVVTSIGTNVEECWGGLLSGKHGIKEIKTFDVRHHLNKLGCEIDQVEQYILPHEQTVGRASSIFQIALSDAIHDANIRLGYLPSERIGLCVGTTMGEVEPFERQLKQQQPGSKGGPYIIMEKMASLYNLAGPQWTLTNACAAGNFAIARAVDELRLGRADVMIAGGVDAMSWAAFTGFASLRAMSHDYCRPFDKDRKGLLLGEGAGVLILETRDHLEKRGGTARARCLGYGMNNDAHHITQPDPEGKGAIRAMKQALLMARISSENIDYVSAHGTGTPANDRMESVAISSLFGEKMVTSSIKGNIGHTLGAASAIEAVICIKMMESGYIPPTLHLREQDPSCQVDVIHSEPRKKELTYVMSNAYAFGGINSSIILGRV